MHIHLLPHSWKTGRCYVLPARLFSSASPARDVALFTRRDHRQTALVRLGDPPIDFGDRPEPTSVTPHWRGDKQCCGCSLPHFSRVRRQDHRRNDATGISVLLGFCTELLQVFERKLLLLHGWGSCSRRETGPLAEHHEIEQ